MNKEYQFSVRVTFAEYDIIQRAADKMDVPKSQIVRHALRQHVSETRRKLDQEAIGVDKNEVRETSIVVRIDDDLRERVERKAEDGGVKKADLHRYAIRQFIEEYQTKDIA